MPLTAARRPATALLALAILYAAHAPLPAQERNDALAAALALEQALVSTIEDVEPSVVSIIRIRASRPAVDIPFQRERRFGPEQDLRLDPHDPASPDFVANEFGAGIIIAAPDNPGERLILTNYHVVRGGPVFDAANLADSQRLHVRFADRRGCDASIFAADPRSDLAVLKLHTEATAVNPAELRPARITAQDEFRKGRIVFALGNPYALARDGSASASWGIISNVARHPAPVDLPSLAETQKQTTIHHYGTLLQIDTRLNLGTSGGAVMNLDGELIGITTALAALDGYEKSVGYAIPFDSAVRRIVDELARGYEVEYGLLGIQPGSADPGLVRVLRESTGLRRSSAAAVRGVPRNSPADRAGVRRDDLIVSISGRPVHSSHDLMRDIGQLPPGEPVALKIWRPGDRRLTDVTVTLAKWPVQDDEGIIATRQRFPAWRGVTVDYPTGRYKYLDAYHQFDSVLVTRVAPQSEAAAAGLQEGDFISHVGRDPVKTPAEFHAALRNRDAQPVTLQLISKKPVTIPAAPGR